MPNPIFHFEIPVSDMDRAVAFYHAIFGVEFSRQTIDGYDMAFFPRDSSTPGASGALAKGDVYKPTHDGCILYFDVDDIDQVIEKAQKLGAEILYPKTDVGSGGFVAEIEDSEGNRIALNMMKS